MAGAEVAAEAEGHPKQVNQSLRTVLIAFLANTGDDAEPSLAVRLRPVERELEQQDHIEEAVLNLATPEEVSLAP